ncbi:MAG: glycoside hydrolase family 11 protein, partial [Oscillospiraceae bacterium]|nr:glycoside hydrolase family 11 protein [Oscillospiraceae bacterium]
MLTAAMPISQASAGLVLYDCKTGIEDGYNYELWKDTGNTKMELTGNGTFNCEWSNINNCLFRTGKKFDCTQTYKEIGNIAFDYNVDYHPDGNSYLCVYGWTKEPLVEYYIVDSWGSWRPPGNEGYLGEATIDGAVYDIYKTVRVDQPSIVGNTTFDQYWSVRKDKRTSGVINVASHFAAWEEMGLPAGKLYEAALNIEGYQSAGSATVLTNEMTVGG